MRARFTTPCLAYTELRDEGFAAIVEWDVLAMLLGGATMVVEKNLGGVDIWIQFVECFGFRSNLGLTYPGDVAAGLATGLKLHNEQRGHYNARASIRRLMSR